MVKNPPASAEDTGDAGLIPRLGRSPGGGNSNLYCSVLAWKVPWTEEPGGLQSSGSKTVGNDLVTEHIHKL